MEVLLEVFQEAITRLPRKIAGAAGVVGALVIGTTVVMSFAFFSLLYGIALWRRKDEG